MATQTALYDLHKDNGAHMVDFHGWQMPLHYGSQLQEHLKVRQHAGLFDISHMAIVDISGRDATAYLRYLLANDIAKLKVPGKAQYSLMLTPQGTVIDDLIVYYLAEGQYRLILNAACRDKDLAWLGKQASAFTVEIQPRDDLCLLSLQGPDYLDILGSALSATQFSAVHALRPFDCIESDSILFAHTGYTGELGIEIALPAEQARTLWQTLTDNGVQTVGLGARDTLRLEAGMNLYGQEMDEHTSPFAANLGWTIAFEPAERDFIGREAVSHAREKPTQQLLGLILREKGVMHRGMTVSFEQEADGVITSGGYSPMLECSIALARAPISGSDKASLELHGKRIGLEVTTPVFVRHGQILPSSLSRKVST